MIDEAALTREPAGLGVVLELQKMAAASAKEDAA